MKPRSAKTADRDARRRELVEQMLSEEPRCRIRWASCTGRSETLHDKLLRSRGGDPTDRANNVPACHRCHSDVHANPERATAEGWMQPSWKER